MIIISLQLQLSIMQLYFSAETFTHSGASGDRHCVDPPLPLANCEFAQLTEPRADDLRFTDEEAKTFLHQSLSQPLTKVQVTTSKRKPKAGLRITVSHALTARYRKSCGVD